MSPVQTKGGAPITKSKTFSKLIKFTKRSWRSTKIHHFKTRPKVENLNPARQIREPISSTIEGYSTWLKLANHVVRFN